MTNMILLKIFMITIEEIYMIRYVKIHWLKQNKTSPIPTLLTLMIGIELT